MGIPQVIFVVLATMDITIHLCCHRKPLEGEYNVWWETFCTVAFTALLYWGGFFG